MAVENWSLERLLSEVDKDHHELVTSWLDRGDGVACYENKAFDHSWFGHKKFISFGSSAAQIERDEPPEQLPDIGRTINWPYWLIAITRR